MRKYNTYPGAKRAALPAAALAGMLLLGACSSASEDQPAQSHPTSGRPENPRPSANVPEAEPPTKSTFIPAGHDKYGDVVVVSKLNAGEQQTYAKSKTPEAAEAAALHGGCLASSAYALELKKEEAGTAPVTDDGAYPGKLSASDNYAAAWDVYDFAIYKQGEAPADGNSFESALGRVGCAPLPNPPSAG